MALRDVRIPVRLVGGVSLKADPKVVATAQLLGLDNGRFAKMGSIQKRLGHTALSQSVLGSATPYSNIRGLSARGSELVLFTEGTSYSYIEGAESWSQIPDGVMSVRQSDEALTKTTSGQTTCDYAACDGIALVCWVDSRGGVYYAVTESDNGRVIVSPRQASNTGSRPRAVRCGDDKLHLLWAEAALGQIHIIVIDTNAPHSPSASAVLTDGLVTTLPNFDAAFVSNANAAATSAACITWNAPDGIHVAWLTPAGTIGTVGQGYPSPATITSEAIHGGTIAGPVISPSVENSYAWAIGWVRNQAAFNPHVALATSSLGAPATPVSCTAAWGMANAGSDYIAIALRDYTAGVSATIDVWAEVREATIRNSNVSHYVADPIALTVTAGTPQTFRGAVLGSSGFVDIVDGTPRAYVTLLHPLPLQSTYLTIRDDGLCVAQTLSGICGAAQTTHRLPRVTDTDDDRTYQWCAVFKNKLDALNDDLFTESGPRLVTMDFNADDAYQAVNVGRSLYLGGACPMLYDGVSWVEAQIHYAPDWEVGAVLHTNSTAGTGGLTTGTRSYLFWYEATLANGEIIRGPTSKPYEVEITNPDDRTSITVPTCRLSAWGRSGGSRENMRVCAARSEAGDTSLYYRITSLDPSTAGAANGYVANSQSVDTVTIIDEVSDDNLELNGDPHYTTGGVPSNAPAPSSGIVAEGKGRLFLASSSDPNAIYFSQERAEGISIEFADLRIVTPPTGGRVTGIAVMDDSVVIFKERAIYRVVGNGPLPNPNAGGDWSLPQLVTSDVGCSDQRTICTTPMGLVFQSAKGIYQLGRDFQVSYIGANVELYNDQSFVRATLDESTREIRFLTAEGSSLLYDYSFGQWSLLTNHLGHDAVMVNGAYHYLRTDGRVFKASSEYRDDNFSIPLRIDTAHIRLGEARQGFQYIRKLQVLGTWKSPHILRVSYKLDYDEDDAWTPLPDQETPLSMGGDNYGDGPYGEGNYGGSTPQRYQFTFHIGRHCQSIQFRFEFIEETGVFGACAELTELLIIGGARQNENKVPANRMG